MDQVIDSLPVGVIFDWDNTLVDTWPTITVAVNAARSAFGLCTWTVEEARPNCTLALRDSFPVWFGDNWEKARDIFYDCHKKVHLEYLAAMPGAEELLSFFEDQKIPMFVVSNKKNVVLQAEADHLGWSKRFVAMAGSLDAPRDKPTRDPVDLVLAKAGLKADNPRMWFIGDTISDVQCALNSGCMPVLVYAEALAKKLGIRLSFSDCHNLKTALYNHSKVNLN